MKIACIGWGSLIWDQRNLKVKGEWFNDGPKLPIEFARESGDGRITLVIEEKSEVVMTFWSIFITEDFDEALESLRSRERTNIRHIHHQLAQEETKSEIERIIKSWLIEKNLDCAIWTGLPPKFSDVENKVPTINEILEYIASLDELTLNKTKEYIQNTPQQISTNFRNSITEKFHW